MVRIVTRSASVQEIARIYDDMNKVERSRAVERDGIVLAIGLLVWHVANVIYLDAPPRMERRLWLNFDAGVGADKVALAIVRAARDMLSGVRETVYAIGDEQQHATARRLLDLCGFQPTIETWGGERIWLRLP